MFDHFRRHQKWLWIVIVFLVIISFVIWFSPQQANMLSGGLGSSDDVVATMDGRPITRQEYMNAFNEARLRYRLFRGSWPENDPSARMFFDRDREVQTRLVFVEELNKLGLKFGDELVVEWVQRVFQDPEEGRFNLELYRQFVDRVLRPEGYTERDFKRFVQHEVGIQHLASIYGLSGTMVPPQEAEQLYRRRNDKVDTKIASFSASNYLAQVSIDPQALQQFYTNQASRYRLPERLQVSYVKFDPTNYLAEAEEELLQVSNLNEILAQQYLQRGTNAYPGLTPEEAQQAIRQELLDQQAMLEARRKANEFTEQLMEMEPPDPANLERLAAAQGLVSDVTEPFSNFESPPDLNVPSRFSEVAYSLNQAQPFSPEPIRATDAVYVISVKNRIPSEVPPFEAVQERVVEDYRRDEALKLARETGNEFYNVLTNGLAEGKSLETMAEEAGVNFVDLPPFSQQTSSVPELEVSSTFPALKSVAFDLEPEEVSSFNPTPNGGFIAYLEKRIPVGEEELEKELPSFVEELRQSRKFEAFNAWVSERLAQNQFMMAGAEQETQTQ